MANEIESPQSSLRNNIMIAFFLVIIIGGVTFTVLFQHVIQTTLIQEGLEKTIIEKIARHFTFMLTGFTMAGIFIALFIALLLSNTITRPIKLLAEGVSDVARGRLDVKIDVVSQDEFGQLADSFNKMTENLKESKDVLRRKSRQLETLAKDLRNLSTHLVKEEELSRRKFAMVLHEQVGQNLAALRIKCYNISDESLSNRGEIKKTIHDLISLLDDTIRSTKELTSDLYPVILDSLGFIPAVTWYRDLVLKPNNLEVSLDIDSSVEDLPSESKLSLFRIVQEGFQNIVKHSKATEVEVVLKRLDSSMMLYVKDNGIGLDYKEIEKKIDKGIGLMLIKERSLSLGGSFEVKSSLKRGTEFTVEIPVKD